ncbi:MAG: ribosome small subunit-dependent GTPase A [Paludibacteraceae bacterium]|nr:ribosome small subunit-dependent GTPase A [Paludibacteraceae bacterium]
MRGLVIKSTGSSYIVRMDDGSDVECRIKGNFRIRGIRSTNPVAVGDYVEVQSDNRLSDKGHSVYWITEVEDRRNYIIRRSTNLSKESHILAANIDQVALIVTVNHPVTSTTFIDRFLATAEAYRVPTVLIFNKIDLLTEEELAHLEELRKLYESIGYQTLAISALAGRNGLAGLSGLLTGKTTLLSGNSGVGKSTLLNALFGREMTRTGKISDAHDKGMHTTTFSEMYELKGQRDEGQSTKESIHGWLIDTPGIKGFGTIDFEKEEVSHYFREIFRISADCRFGNCTHTNEPGCAVQQAAIEGRIAISRLESYMSLLGDCTESKYR